ncbi:MAG: helix-turn-helix domain-containing protein, partial [Planctomycetales bacterium]|nr:helix-turn-helix domain-containing protein [Planctomycetales bacterium]
MPQTYTTGQVGKICKVAASTVNKWFDSGQLKGYRVPGSRHRRIPRESLVEFLKAHDLPLDILQEAAQTNVLVVVRDTQVFARLDQQFRDRGGFQLAAAASGFEAGIQAETHTPRCVIVDFATGQFDALQICRNLRRRRRLAGVVIVALLPADRQLSALERSLV